MPDRVYAQQKAALTRAVKSGNLTEIRAACKAARDQWRTQGMWPDGWARWQRALDDAYAKRFEMGPRLEDL